MLRYCCIWTVRSVRRRNLVNFVENDTGVEIFDLNPERAAREAYSENCNSNPNLIYAGVSTKATDKFG